MPHAPFYTTRIPVRWGDMDALGHVNNATYLTYVEQARLECLERLPGSPWPGSTDQGPLLVALEVSYRGRTSFAFDNRITVEADAGMLYAEVRTVLVWVDYATGRPIPVPPALRASLLEAAGRQEASGSTAA